MMIRIDKNGTKDIQWGSRAFLIFKFFCFRTSFVPPYQGHYRVFQSYVKLRLSILSLSHASDPSLHHVFLFVFKRSGIRKGHLCKRRNFHVRRLHTDSAIRVYVMDCPSHCELRFSFLSQHGSVPGILKTKIPCTDVLDKKKRRRKAKGKKKNIF